MLEQRWNFEGLPYIRKIFAELPDTAREAIGIAVEKLRGMVLERTPYKTGRLKRSWSDISYTDGGMSWNFVISSSAPYALTVEYGLYPRLGPRTVMGPDGGIYSSQVVDSEGVGMVRPVIQNERNLEDILDFVIDELVRGIESGGA